jgi:flagellar basal-body rod protein FlgB
MIDGLFNQANYVATKKMLDATALRQEAIASNIANLETPGYKRIDVAPAFSEELKRALASGQPSAISQLQPSLAVDPKAIASTRDGNTVQLESELMELNQNALAHAVETQLVSGTLMKLQLAISGRSS